ncbi:hypothetical protein F4779DRAFT_608098 [Xylariaceae sp. FL0662B]|nr:hypothetical protein F4779DRAFT_608098 [Xylariaceae sp. FL0662B]
MNTVNYVFLNKSPAESRTLIRSLFVEKVLAVGTGNAIGEGGNRWTLYLRLAHRIEDWRFWRHFPPDTEKFVVLEANPESPNDARARVEATAVAGDIEATSDCVVPLPVANNGVSVGEYVDFLLQAKLHRYVFTPSGAGGNKWIADLIKLFHEKRLLASMEQVSKALDSISTEWRRHRPTGRRFALTAGRYLRGE